MEALALPTKTGLADAAAEEAQSNLRLARDEHHADPGQARSMPSESYPGVWWLPDRPDDRVVGDLTFTHEDGPRLELRGILGGAESGLMALAAARVESHARVLGRVQGLQPVTLDDCVVTRSSVGWGEATQTLRPRIAYLGASAEEEGPLLWRCMRLRMRHLLQWFGDDGVSENWDREAGRGTLHYERPETLSASTDNWSVSLRPRLSHIEPDGVIPRWQPYVEFEVTLPFAVDYPCFARLFLTSLQDLITLAAGQAAWLTDVIVAKDESSESWPGARILVGSYRASSDNPDPVRPEEWLFTAKTLGPSRFADVLVAWLGAAEKFRAPRALLFEEFYRGLTPLENRFLLTVLAAETFHGLRFPGAAEVSDTAHEKRMAEVLAAIPEKHRSWVVDALAYSNQLSLRRRLKELIRGANPVLIPLIPKPNPFVETVVRARNDLIHRASISDVPPSRLLHITETLRLMLQVWFLREAGLPPEDMTSAFHGTRRFKNAIAFGRHPDAGPS